MTEKIDDTSVLPSTRAPLIFISHDTRDAALAEAFSRLLSSVSAGVLKSFRSSDKKGNQGIEYGVEWYPEIMKKLEAASDVVCLLTPNSVGRPWILYEAGVAKGKLETPVHGLALGLSLQNASVGPFAQFQNSDDSEDAVTQLVMQLVRRIPGAEPDREVVKLQVEAFRKKGLPLAKPDDDSGRPDEQEDTSSVVKLFEEVKVMFQDLPSRIEGRGEPGPSLRKRHLPAKVVFELAHGHGRDMPAGVRLLIAASQFKDEIPWLYEMTLEAYQYMTSGDLAAGDSLQRLDQAFRATFKDPSMIEYAFGTTRRFDEAAMLVDIFHRAVTKARDSTAHRTVPQESIASGWTDERLDILRQMWADGKTASEIAETLGSVSRNAVIGKAHRLGLQSRPSPQAPTNEEQG
jgi:hypothetical protein